MKKIIFGLISIFSLIFIVNIVFANDNIEIKNKPKILEPGESIVLENIPADVYDQYEIRETIVVPSVKITYLGEEIEYYDYLEYQQFMLYKDVLDLPNDSFETYLEHEIFSLGNRFSFAIETNSLPETILDTDVIALHIQSYFSNETNKNISCYSSLEWDNHNIDSIMIHDTKFLMFSNYSKVGVFRCQSKIGDQIAFVANDDFSLYEDQGIEDNYYIFQENEYRDDIELLTISDTCNSEYEMCLWDFDNPPQWINYPVYCFDDPNAPVHVNKYYENVNVYFKDQLSSNNDVVYSTDAYYLFILDKFVKDISVYISNSSFKNTFRAGEKNSGGFSDNYFVNNEWGNYSTNNTVSNVHFRAYTQKEPIDLYDENSFLNIRNNDNYSFYLHSFCTP